MIPQELICLNQWVAWWSVAGDGKPIRLPNGSITKPLPRRAKPHKLPINAITGGLASSTDPASWSSYEQALEAVRRFSVTGVGFVFADSDPYTGIDLDDCRDRDSGAIADWAQEILTELNSYAEISPSGTGVKAVVLGQLPAVARNRKKHGTGQIEIYSRKRYFTVTGLQLEGTPTTIEERQEQLLRLHARIFGVLNGNSRGPLPSAPAPVPSRSLTDCELLDRARRARNGPKFQRLWDGQWQGDYLSQSEADMALCCELAFWSGRDPQRIDHFFRQSGLMREKWDREDYRDRTIAVALERTTDTYCPISQATRNEGDAEFIREEQPDIDENRELSGKAFATGEGKSETESGSATGLDSRRRPSNEHGTPNIVRESQATKLLKLVSDVEYFKSPEGKPHATFALDSHEETYLLRSKGFRVYLYHRYYVQTGHALTGKALQDTLGVLEGKAIFEGKQHDVYCRVGECDNNIYIDLGSSRWDAIEVSREGWTVTPAPPVKFRRSRGMLAIPQPIRGPGASEHFRSMINVKPDHGDLMLVTAWELAAMRPKGPFPVLILNSGQGSGKTSISRLLRSLLDPNFGARQE